jgi:hypothetical protein
VVALSLRGYGNEEDDRPEKPRRYGVTEMRSPFYSFRPANQALQVRRRLTAASLTPLFWGRCVCSALIRLVLCCAELDAWIGGILVGSAIQFPWNANTACLF